MSSDPTPAARVDALLQDPDLARLDALGAPFDPLSVLGWSARERAHTRLLAWLLDPMPRGPERAHGLGTAVLEAVLRAAFDGAESPAPQGFHDVHGWREARLGDGLRATARAPDLRCEWVDDAGVAWVMLIEDKLDAAEGDDQLADYLAWMRAHRSTHRHVLIYLTPDGRAPSSSATDPALRLMRWATLADAALAALPEDRDDEAARFARVTLRALRHRFDAPPEARALLEAIYLAHPVAAELVASGACDPALSAPVAARFPSALWRLRSAAPREPARTVELAEMVRDAFNAIALQRFRMRVGASEGALSWSFEGVSERVALHLHLWPGHRVDAPGSRWFVAIHAPNRSLAEATLEREQGALVAALPDETRAWLQSATPVIEPDGSWRWLRVGSLRPMLRGIDARAVATRFAATVNDVLGQHLTALGRAFASPSARLFSADLDLDHLLPIDVRDREALHAEARADARHALIVAPNASAPAKRLRAAATVGCLFAETYGGTGALSYDYVGAFSLGLAGRGRALLVVPLAAVARQDAARLRALIDALDGDVLLLGVPSEESREALGALLPITAHETVDPSDAALQWHGVASTLRDLRGLGARGRVKPGASAEPVASAEGDPVVLVWRVERARVALLPCDVAPLRGMPERFGRWVRALLGALERVRAEEPARAASPRAPAVSGPALPSTPPVMRRALAPARKRAGEQAVMPWGAKKKLPAQALASTVIQDLDEVVIVDTETTGLSSSARIVEIGALHVRAGVVVAKFQTLVDPEEPIPHMVIRVHGITDAMVKGAPRIGDAIAAWQRFVAGRPVLAHNASFDHRMFAQECARAGVASPGLAFWCTKRIAKAAFPNAPGFGLAALARWLQLPSPPTHRAIADCTTTHGLLAACRAVASDAKLSAAHGPPKPL